MLWEDVHGVIVLGIIGGMLGAIFINTNTVMGALRKKYVTTTMRRTIETGMFGLMTMSVCVLFIAFGDKNDCQTPNIDTNDGNFNDKSSQIDVNNL